MTPFLQPPSVLLAGPSGSGKTSAIATQLLYGLEVFVITTEAGGVESLLDSCERLRTPIDNLHWATCQPRATGWMELEDMITKISIMDQKGLADVRDMGKAAFRASGMAFLNALKNFTCERTGECFGDFTTWDDSRSLNIDSLTGWSAIAWGVTVGYKPTANPGEWGIAQNFIANMLKKINNDRRCFFNLTAHIEKENDELIGVKRVMVSTIGAKLAPKIPTEFSELVKCSRGVDAKGNPDFSWSTLDAQMDLKNRALPINSKLPADFGPIIAAHRRRKTLAQGNGTQPVKPQTEAALTAKPQLPAAPMTKPAPRSN